MEQCRRAYTLLGISCLAVFHLQGQSNLTDTLKLETAVVKSAWSTTESRRALSEGLLTIDPGAGLADDLSLLGENVQDYGIPGAAQLLRPSGLSAELATFNWKGLEINAPGLGLLDLSLIPARFASLQQDPRDNFGSYAIGQADAAGDQLQIWSSMTTLQNWEQGLTIRQTVSGGFSLAVNALRRELLNEFEFNDRLRNDEAITQTHNNSNEWQLAPELAWQSGNHTLKAFAWWSQREMEIPELMGSYAEGDAVQEDDNLRWGLSYGLLTGGIQVSMLLGEVRDAQGFRDHLQPDGSFLVDSRIETLRRQARFEIHSRRERTKWSFLAHPEIWGISGANYFNGSATEFRSRVEAGVEHSFRNFSLNARIGVLSAGDLQPAATAELKFYPLQGGEDLCLTAQAQRLYRWPTLNEKYWVPGGNPDIQPEHGWNGQLGLAWKAIRTVTLELEAFSTSLNNRILWKPEANVWSPFNVDHVRREGFHATLTCRREVGKWRIDATANYQYAKTSDSEGFELPYAPRHRMGSWTTVCRGNALLFSGLTATGMRYSGFEMDPFTALDPNQIWQAGLGYKMALMDEWSLTLSISAENILDQQLELVRLRPVPGRFWRCTLAIRYQKDQEK